MKEHLEYKHTKMTNTNVSLSILDLFVLQSTRVSSFILINLNDYKLILMLSLVNLKLTFHEKGSSQTLHSDLQQERSLLSLIRVSSDNWV